MTILFVSILGICIVMAMAMAMRPCGSCREAFIPFSYVSLEAKQTQDAHDTYPNILEKPLLSSFPAKHTNQTSNKNYHDIWKEYPILPMSSFVQQTNNIRYPKNPDQGTCIRADFCNAFYDDTLDEKSNIICPLPPVIDDGIRIGYFVSDNVVSK